MITVYRDTCYPTERIEEFHWLEAIIEAKCNDLRGRIGGNGTVEGNCSITISRELRSRLLGKETKREAPRRTKRSGADKKRSSANCDERKGDRQQIEERRYGVTRARDTELIANEIDYKRDGRSLETRRPKLRERGGRVRDPQKDRRRRPTYRRAANRGRQNGSDALAAMIRR